MPSSPLIRVKMRMRNATTARGSHHQTQNRCPNQFEPFVVFHIGFSPFCVF
jgi:hypothetical protein